MYTKLLGSSYNCIVFISTIVISEPDDATVCEGEQKTLICTLSGSMTSDDVHWYRMLKDTGTAERLGRLNDFIVVPLPGANSFTTRLLISDASRSYTGYYWVSSPVGEVCNTSFTVSTGTLYSMLHIMFYNMPVFSNIILITLWVKLCMQLAVRSLYTYTHFIF